MTDHDKDGFKPVTEADVAAAFEAGDIEKAKELSLQLAKSVPGLYKRAKQAEEENDTLKKDPRLAAPEKKEDPSKNQPGPVETPKRTQDHPDYQDLRFDGYSLEEADFIIKNGGREALEKNPFVKTAIETSRADKKKKETSEEATPESSPKSPVYKHYTEGELKSKSSKELEEIIPKGPNS